MNKDFSEKVFVVIIKIYSFTFSILQPKFRDKEETPEPDGYPAANHLRSRPVHLRLAYWPAQAYSDRCFLQMERSRRYIQHLDAGISDRKPRLRVLCEWVVSDMMLDIQGWDSSSMESSSWRPPGDCLSSEDTKEDDTQARSLHVPPSSRPGDCTCRPRMSSRRWVKLTLCMKNLFEFELFYLISAISILPFIRSGKKLVHQEKNSWTWECLSMESRRNSQSNFWK